MTQRWSRAGPFKMDNHRQGLDNFPQQKNADGDNKEVFHYD